jgi:hypothetical protein
MGNGRIDTRVPFAPSQIDPSADVEAADKSSPASDPAPANENSTPSLSHNPASATAMRNELSLAGFGRAVQLQAALNTGGSKYQNDLKKDPNFQKLSPAIQQQILNDLDLLFQSPKSSENLVQLAKDPNFYKLSEHAQNTALNNFRKDPVSAHNLNSIKSEISDRVRLEQNNNYQKLPPETQKQISDLIDRFPLKPEAREQLIQLVIQPELKELSVARQNQVLNAYAKAPGDSAYRSRLQDIVRAMSRGNIDEATQSRILNMVEKSGNTRLTSDLAKLVDDPRFAALGPTFQEKLLNVFESTTPDGREALHAILQKQFNPPQHGPTFQILSELDRLAQGNIAPAVTDQSGGTAGKAQVMENLLNELATPNTHINQDNKGTCTCTSMSYALAKNNPAEYARIATDLLTTGQATLKTGSVVSPPLDGFAFDGSQRSASERLIQSALMNLGMGGNYSNVRDQHVVTGVRGLTYAQEAIVAVALNGKWFSVHTEDVLGRVKSDLKEGNVPVLVNLRWGGRNSAHAIQVEKIENGRVYFRNPWGGNIPGVQPGVGNTGHIPGPGGPLRRVEDGQNGIESMSVEVFEGIALSAVTAD